MEISTILYIALALLIALGFAFFQYLFRVKNPSRKSYIFFGLRALALFLVLLILINPKISSETYELEKSQLVILSDNSQSISHLGENENMLKISAALAENKRISEKFDISTFTFGEQLSANEPPNFEATQTDIYKALSETEEILSNRQSAIVLLTDGNQSLGRDYKYFKAKNETLLFPVIFGDTTKYKDLSIGRINANRYAFLNNQFPVEAFLNYNGEEEITATINIKSGEGF